MPAVDTSAMRAVASGTVNGVNGMFVAGGEASMRAWRRRASRGGRKRQLSTSCVPIMVSSLLCRFGEALQRNGDGDCA
jgi:hypothetical protein